VKEYGEGSLAEAQRPQRERRQAPGSREILLPGAYLKGQDMLTEGGLSRRVSPALTAVHESLCDLSDLCERRKDEGSVSHRGTEATEVGQSVRKPRDAASRRGATAVKAAGCVDSVDRSVALSHGSNEGA